MILGEEARIELSLYANNYLAGLSNVTVETKNRGKTVEEVFSRMDKSLHAVEAQYMALGDEAKASSQQHRILENAIKALLRNGVDPADDAITRLRIQMQTLRPTAGNVESVFAELSRQTEIATNRFKVYGDESEKLADDKRALRQAIDSLIKSGIQPEDAAVQKLKGQLDTLSRATDSAGVAQKTLKQSFADLRDVMQGPVAAAREVAQAIGQMVRVGTDLYNEFAQAERGQVIFAQAVKDGGVISREGALRLKEYAAELQDLTGIDADNTQAIMGNLAAQGKSENQIRALTEAAANYAAGAGIDYETAIKQLSSTLGGNVRELGRTNSAVKELTAEQLKSGKAIEVINEQYAGMAEALGKSAMGAADRLAANVGDLKESLGEIVAYKFGPLIENMVNAAGEASRRIAQATTWERVKAGDLIDLESFDIAIEYQQKRFEGFKKALGGEAARMPTGQAAQEIAREQGILISLQEKRKAALDKATTAEIKGAKAAAEARGNITDEDTKALAIYQKQQEAIDRQLQAAKITEEVTGEKLTAEKQSAIYLQAALAAIQESEGAITGNVGKAREWLDKAKALRGEFAGMTTEEIKLQRAAEDAMAAAFDFDSADAQSAIQLTKEQTKAIEDSMATMFDAGNANAEMLDELTAGQVALQRAAENTMAAMFDVDSADAQSAIRLTKEQEKAIDDAMAAMFDAGNANSETLDELTSKEVKLQRAAEDAMAALFDADSADAQSAIQLTKEQTRAVEDSMAAMFDAGNANSETLEKLTAEQIALQRAAEDAMAAMFDFDSADAQSAVEANDALVTSIEKGIESLDEYAIKTYAAAEAQSNMANVAIGSYSQIAAALGEAIVTGEDGWKSLGKTALNAIAAIVEGLGKQAAIEGAINLGKIFAGDLKKIPALAQNALTVGLASAAAGAIRAIPMAEGGAGKVDKPTLFLAGEAGEEDYVFAPKKKGGLEKSPALKQITEAMVNQEEAAKAPAREIDKDEVLARDKPEIIRESTKAMVNQEETAKAPAAPGENDDKPELESKSILRKITESMARQEVSVSAPTVAVEKSKAKKANDIADIIPMAEGGSGKVDRPTLFMAGEAGPERFSFQPLSGGLKQQGGNIIIVQNIGGSVIAERQVKQLAIAGIAAAGRGY